jgi:hypothetical protein
MAVEAMTKAGTARVVGSVPKVPGGGGAYSYDMRSSAKGAVGTVTQKGVKVRAITVGDRMYIKADRRGWAAMGLEPSISGGLVGRWVDMGTPGVPGGTQLNYTLMVETLRDYTGGLKPKATASTLDGRKVVVLSYADGSKVWVAATGPAYVLRADTVSPARGTVRFSEFGRKVEVAAPKDAVTL